MKKILAMLLFLSAIVERTFSATGERSDDYLVVLVPGAVLVLMWGGYRARTKWKERKQRQADALNQQAMEDNAVTGEGSEA